MPKIHNASQDSEQEAILVHICCSVDSHYFLSRLREAYPKSKLIGYFYNPNIHPREEYDLRLSDVSRSCEILNIELIEGEYELEAWLDDTKGLECEPEKGARCLVCFDTRLVKSAKMAKDLGIKNFSTTLLSSPLKEQQILFAQGDKIAHNFGLEFIKIDVRSNGGTQAQSELANTAKLYKQNYCGCVYALNAQREKRDELPLELMSNIGRQVMPGSNEERIAVFAKRAECERAGVEYMLRRESRVIWRNLRSVCSRAGEVIDSYIIAHSASKKAIKSGSIIYFSREAQNLAGEKINIMLGYAKSDDSVFLSIADMAKILGREYKSVREMLLKAPLYEEELSLRQMLCGADSINPIIVLDERIEESLKVLINAYFREGKSYKIVC